MRPPSAPKTPAVKTIHVGGYAVVRRGRFWRVCDPQGRLVVTAVYKKGALEVVRRLLPPDLRPLVDLCPRRQTPCREPGRRYDPHAT